MASAQKPTGARRKMTRAKKPATIDLKATEVKSDAADAKPAVPENKPAATASSRAKTSAKAEVSSSQAGDKKFGREAAKESAKPAQAEKVAEAKSTSAPKGKKPVTPSASKEKKSGGDLGSGIMGGLIGAVVTVAGLGFVGQMQGASNLPVIGPIYQQGGSSNGNNASGDLDRLAARLEALETAGTQGNVNLAPIEERLAKLETTPSGADPEIGNKLSSVENEVGELRQTLQSITNAVSAGGEASSAEVTAALAAVTSRVEAVEKNINANEAALAKITELENSLDSISQSGEIDLSPIESQLEEIRSSLSTLDAITTSNKQGVEALMAQSSTLQETVASVKQSEKVARSVAVNALGTALENDDSLGLALASVKSLIGETPETQRLAALEAEGIPSRVALLDALAVLTDAIQNPKADTGNGSVSDRFWANLQNLVTFRSSGPQEGDGVIAILSRVRDNLEKGNLPGLMDEWQTLPDDVQKSGEDFRTGVERRLEANAIYEKLNSILARTAG